MLAHGGCENPIDMDYCWKRREKSGLFQESERVRSSNYWLFGRGSRLSNTPEETCKVLRLYQDRTK